MLDLKADRSILESGLFIKAIILSGYFLELDTARTARSAGIPMGPRAVLPSNTCGAHQTFHDWL